MHYLSYFQLSFHKLFIIILPKFFFFSILYNIPLNWKEGVAEPKWREAVMKDMEALKKNNTWELVFYQMGKYLWDVNECFH